MNRLQQLITVSSLCALLILLAGCGVSEEKYNEAVTAADDYKTKYEQASSKLEKCSKELEETKDELQDYKPYYELVTYLNNKDYHAAVKLITEMSGEDANLTDSDDKIKNESL